jgi:hypothetical protein
MTITPALVRTAIRCGNDSAENLVAEAVPLAEAVLQTIKQASSPKHMTPSKDSLVSTNKNLD